MLVLVALLCAVFTFLFVLFTALFVRQKQSLDILYRLRRHLGEDSERFKKTTDLLHRAYKFIKRAAKPLERFNLTSPKVWISSSSRRAYRFSARNL